MQIDSSQVFMSLATGALPPLILFSYGYGKINQRLTGVAKNVDDLTKAMKAGFEEIKESLKERHSDIIGLDRRVLVIETSCGKCSENGTLEGA